MVFSEVRRQSFGLARPFAQEVPQRARWPGLHEFFDLRLHLPQFVRRQLRQFADNFLCAHGGLFGQTAWKDKSVLCCALMGLTDWPAAGVGVFAAEEFHDVGEFYFRSAAKPACSKC